VPGWYVLGGAVHVARLVVGDKVGEHSRKYLPLDKPPRDSASSASMRQSMSADGGKPNTERRTHGCSFPISLCPNSSRANPCANVRQPSGAKGEASIASTACAKPAASPGGDKAAGLALPHYINRAAGRIGHGRQSVRGGEDALRGLRPRVQRLLGRIAHDDQHHIESGVSASARRRPNCGRDILEHLRQRQR